MPNWKVMLAWVGCFCLWSALVGAVAYDKGHNSGEKAGAELASKAEKKQHAAEGQTRVLVAELQRITLKSEQEIVEAQAQKRRAEQLAEQLADERKQHAKADAAWQKKFKRLNNKPDCATLKALICESAMDY